MPLAGVSSSFVGPRRGIAAISPRVHCFDVDGAAIITEPRGGAPRLPDRRPSRRVAQPHLRRSPRPPPSPRRRSRRPIVLAGRSARASACRASTPPPSRGAPPARRGASPARSARLVLDTKGGAVGASNAKARRYRPPPRRKDLYGPTPDAAVLVDAWSPRPPGPSIRRRRSAAGRNSSTPNERRRRPCVALEAEGALLTAAHAAISHHLAPPADRRAHDRRSRCSIIGARSSGSPLERARRVLWRLGPRSAEFGRELAESPHFEAAVRVAAEVGTAMTPVARAFGMGGEAARSQRSARSAPKVGAHKLALALGGVVRARGKLLKLHHTRATR